MKTIFAICLLFLASCHVGPDYSLDNYPLKRNFLLQFEDLLEHRYGAAKPDVLFKQFINENYELLLQHTGVCLDDVEKLMENELFEQLWVPIKQTVGVLYFIDFDGWYYGFLDEIKEAGPWIEEYQESVCSAMDITPSAVVLFVDNAATLNLKKEKMRFLVAVHFFSLMIEKGCLDEEPNPG